MLFGAGPAIRFPHPRLTRALTDAGVGVEVMDTPAACRTFNILAAEGRSVVAALLVRVNTPADGDGQLWQNRRKISCAAPASA